MDSTDVAPDRSGIFRTAIQGRSRGELVQWVLQLAMVVGIGMAGFYVSVTDGQYVSMTVSVVFVLWGLPIVFRGFRSD